AVERPFKVLSKADDTWRYALQPPPEGWAAPDFDDGAWPALAKAATPQPTWQEYGSWQCHQCTRLGATCLGRAGTVGNGRVWVRKVFEIPGPEEAAPRRKK